MNMDRQANQYSSYLCGIYTVLGTISHVEMVQVIWQDVEKLNAIAMTFCRKKKKLDDHPQTLWFPRCSKTISVETKGQ